MGSKNLKFAGKLIKIVILILTIVFIYIELFQRRSFTEIMEQFRKQIESGSNILWLVLALMPLNWGLETVKWDFLLRRFHSIPFIRSFQAIMTGVSVSFFTPNRVGEFGGRILYLPPRHRIQGVTASIVGSISQLAVTIIYGLLGLIVYVIKNPNIDFLPINMIIPGSVLLLAITLFAYFRSSHLFKWISHWKMPKNLERFFKACSTYTARELLIALLWSTTRFVVFSTQMALVMYAVVDFKYTPGMVDMLYLLPLYFFTITMVPTIGASEVGTRGMILAQIMYGMATAPDLLLASTLVWFINVIIPSVIGAITVWRIKIALKK